MLTLRSDYGGPPVSEARDRLIERIAHALFDADMEGAKEPETWEGIQAYGDGYHDAGESILVDMLAHSDDLIAVVIETLTCETCEGRGGKNLYDPALGLRPWVSCPDCYGSKLDPVKVQAVLRQFADAGALTQVGWVTPHMADGPNVGSMLDGRFSDDDKPVYAIGPWVPLEVSHG